MTAETRQWPADLSPDALWTWSGEAWAPTTVSPDRRYFWYQGAWYPLPASAQAQPAAQPSASALSARPIHQLVGTTLTWRVETHQALLHSGEEIVAALQGEFRSLKVGLPFKGLAADGTWVFEHGALRQGHVTVTTEATGAVILEFTSHGMFQTNIDLPSGQSVGFRAKNPLTKSWQWVDAGGQSLVVMERQAMAGWSSSVQQGDVKIEQAAGSIPELSLLLLMGQFLARIVDQR